MGSERLPDGWVNRRLGDVVDKRGVTYGVVQPGPFVDEGVPLVRVADFQSGRINSDSLVRIAPSVASRHKRSTLCGGEVLVTLVGTVGLVAVAQDDLRGANVARAIGVLPIPDASLANWVASNLRSAATRRFFMERVNTTVQTTLNLADLAALSFPCPPEAEMSAINHVIAHLDDKIESNQSLGLLFDRICEEYFNYITATDKSWRRMPLEELADINARSHSNVDHPDFVDYVDIASTSRRRIDAIKRMPYAEAPSRARRVLRSGDTIISTVRPERRAMAFVHRATPEMTASTGFAVLTPTVGAPTFVYRSATSDACIAQLVAEVSGSAYPAVNPDVLGRVEVCVPPDAGQGYEAFARPAEAKIAQLAHESAVLASVRDALLPKLVSGQIRVPLSKDPEEQVGAAVEVLSGL
jgi:type I restriction enzyme S subunit